MGQHMVMRKGRKKGRHSENRVVKQVITGTAVPKSLAFIELEKNYALLAGIMNDMIDRMRTVETKMEKLEKKVAKRGSSKKGNNF